jgi:hypothetical protein
VTALRRKSLADIRRRPGRSIAILLAIVISVGGLSCADVAERALSGDYAFTPVIAERLTITEGTVKTHVNSILTKLGVADRTQAAVLAWREGIVDTTTS